MIVVFITILGFLIGSFLNVVIFRLHRQESFIKGSSKCLFCKHRLYAKDLVPVFSYIFLKGRCRYCQHRFSRQYPLVEMAAALAFVLVFINLVPSLNILYLNTKDILHILNWFVISSFLIVILVYDLKYFLILDIVIWPAVVFVFVANIFLGFSFLNLLIGLVIGGGFFYLQYAISKGKWIGGGDILLGILMGVILGWPMILTALYIAYILGGVVAITLLLMKKKKFGNEIPFGTFLALATFVTMLYGEVIYNWYLNLF